MSKIEIGHKVKITKNRPDRAPLWIGDIVLVTGIGKGFVYVACDLNDKLPYAIDKRYIKRVPGHYGLKNSGF